MKRSMPKKSELKKEGLSFVRAGNDAYFTVIGDVAAVLCDTIEQARNWRDSPKFKTRAMLLAESEAEMGVA